MSYSKSYKHTIRIPFSVDVSYPASENGGTIHVSDHVEETVYVDIDVDTDPFDASVENCNEHVMGLTASVGAMNAAQCATVHENSKKIARAVVSGFFSTVKSDLTAQRAQLQQVVEARLLLLRQQAQTLLNKRKDMEANYARTSARYIKIFDDLNQELNMRIHQIDQPVFRVVATVDEMNGRMQNSEFVPSVSAVSGEASTLQAQLNAATTRRHAQQALAQIHDFLQIQAQSAKTTRQTSIDGAGHDTYFAPVCYVESVSEGGRADRQVYVPEELHLPGKGDRLTQAVGDGVSRRPESRVSTQRAHLQPYLQSEIASKVTGTDAHAQRVRDYINRMFNENV